MPASAYQRARKGGRVTIQKWGVESGGAAYRLVNNVHGTRRVGEGERRLRAERHVAVTSEVETPWVLLNQECAEPLRSARLRLLGTGMLVPSLPMLLRLMGVCAQLSDETKRMLVLVETKMCPPGSPTEGA